MGLIGPMWRRPAVALLAGTAVAVASGGTLAPGTSSAARSRPDCLRSGQTVAANDRVRVFTVGAREDYVAHWCWTPKRKVREIGTYLVTGSASGPDSMALAGRFIAYRLVDCGQVCGAEIVVLDARSGRVVRHVAPTAAPGPPLVNRRGDVVWAETDEDVKSVRAASARVVQTLGSGPAVDLGSLALNGRRVYWLDGGEPRTALLP